MNDKADPLALVGTTVAEKYAVEAVVGEGGFAIVYRATHTLWKRPVALKVFNALAAASPDVRERLLADFVREGALLAELSEQSAAICQARDVGMLKIEGRDIPFMVLEWLEGTSLEGALEDDAARGVLPRTLEEAIALLDPVAEALALAHARGIAHRDVKPANIFVLGDPRAPRPVVKLLDFGIAKVVQDAEKMGGSFTKTRGDMTSFTPAYGAPEQFARSYGATGPWTDVFALALIVGEVLSGKPPLDGETLAQVAFASTNEARRPTPASLGVTLDREAEAIFARALAVKPADRFPDAAAFWSALRVATGGRAMSLGAVGIPPAPTSSKRDLETARTVAAPSALASSGPVSAAVSATANPVSTTAGGSSSPNKSLVAFVAVPLLLVVVAGIGVVAVRSASESSGKPAASAVASNASAASSSAASAGAAPSAVAMPTCPDGMLPIPGGSFFMGDDDGEAAEKPAHRVLLMPYCIDRYEVTVADYKACSDAGECLRASLANDWPGITKQDHDAYDPLCNARDPGARGRHPVNCVDHAMASSYCRAKKGRRLPTEAEWEFAARGKDGRRYPWGDEAPTGGHLNACGTECVAWGKTHGVTLHAMYAKDDGFAATAPVGSFPAGKTVYGVEDMVGNVWEWVEDAYADYPSNDPGMPLMDPHGPDAESGSMPDRVIRGGAWNSEQASWLRPSFRFHAPRAMKSHGIGFRCASAAP